MRYRCGGSQGENKDRHINTGYRRAAMKANIVAPITLEAGLRADQLLTRRLRITERNVQVETLRDKETGGNGES